MSEYPEQNEFEIHKSNMTSSPYIPQASAYSPGVSGCVPPQRLAKTNQTVLNRTETKNRVTERQNRPLQVAPVIPLTLLALIKTCQSPADGLRGRKVKGFLLASNVADFRIATDFEPGTSHFRKWDVGGYRLDRAGSG